MIDIKNLTFGYKCCEKNIFNSLSLQFKENGIYGLLGQNGAGKTTLLYLLAGMYFPLSGSVALDKEEVSERRKSTLSKLFVIPDEFEFPDLSLSKFLKLRSPLYKDFSQELFDENMQVFGMSGDITFLTLPASNLEKWISRIAYVFLLCVACYAAFYVGMLLAGALAFTYNSEFASVIGNEKN